MSDPRAQLLENSLETLLKLGTAEQAMALLVDENQNMIVKAAGFERVATLEAEITKLYQDLIKRPEAALRVLLRGGVRSSAVVAPLKGRDRKVCGFVYSECPVSVGAFQFSDLRAIKKFAEELQEDLLDPRATPIPPPKPGPKPKAPTEDPTRLRVALMGVTVLATFWVVGLLISWSLGEPFAQPVVVRTPKPVPAGELRFEDPAIASRFFLLLARRGDHIAAYGLLSVRRKAEYGGVDQFSQDLKAWLDEAEPNDLNRVAVNVGPSSKGRRRSRVEMRDVVDTSSTWDWRLVNEGGWKLDRCQQGPPIGRPPTPREKPPAVEALSP